MIDNPDLILRSAKVTDTPIIRKLVLQAHLNPTGLDWRRFVVAADQAGEVIGCCQVKPHRDGSNELASLVVAGPWQGRGVARALVKHLLAEHPGPLYLMCRSGLGAFYAQFGFQALEESEMPTYFRRVSRLAGLVEPLRKSGEGLLIMGREDLE